MRVRLMAPMRASGEPSLTGSAVLGGVALLIVVDATGYIGKGAQRWLDLGFIRLQPSEFMKPGIVLVLARFYELLPAGDIRSWRAVWPAATLIGVPVALIILQPDLGTALMISFIGVTVMFVAGVPMRVFLIPGAALAVAPLPWRMRWLAAPLVLPLCMPPVERPPSGTFEVLAVDVGQGTAVLVRTHRHLLVYDTGPQYSPVANAGERVLVPLLRGRPRPWMKDDGYRSGRVQEVSLTTDCPIVMDGEIFPVSRDVPVTPLAAGSCAPRDGSPPSTEPPGSA